MKFEVYKQKWSRRGRDGWRWRLRASNGKIVATSGESYRRRADCIRGLLLVVLLDSTTMVEVIGQPGGYCVLDIPVSGALSKAGRQG